MHRGDMREHKACYPTDLDHFLENWTNMLYRFWLYTVVIANGLMGHVPREVMKIRIYDKLPVFTARLSGFIRFLATHIGCLPSK